MNKTRHDPAYGSKEPGEIHGLHQALHAMSLDLAGTGPLLLVQSSNLLRG
jgi:hypothetical protein